MSVRPSVCPSVYPNFLAIWANNGEIRKANLAFTFSFYDSFTVTVWWVLVYIYPLFSGPAAPYLFVHVYKYKYLKNNMKYKHSGATGTLAS